MAGTLSSCVRMGLVDPENGEGLAYTPLNGKSLRDIAGAGLHHGNGRFLNPFSNMPRGGLGRVLFWKLFTRNNFKDDYANEPVHPVRVDWQALKADRGLSITFLKHASILIKDGNRTVLLDPVFSEMFWMIKDFTPLDFTLDAMPDIDHVLITHGHYDHLNTDSLAALGKTSHVVSPLGYTDIFDELGMKNRDHLDWFGTWKRKGLEITLLPCNHWTMRNPVVGPNTALWGSYLIRTPSGATIFLSGDTAYFDGFRQLGEEFDIDLAVFNLGAYEPRWFMAPSHINPPETVQAFRELGARHLMVIHWGTYRLGDEPVHLPPIDIRQEMAQAGLLDRLIEIRHGETVFYDRAPVPRGIV